MKEKVIETAAKAHTNLNIFAAVIGMLESGVVYPVGTAPATVSRIVKLCAVEQERQLRIYDNAIAKVDSL